MQYRMDGADSVFELKPHEIGDNMLRRGVIVSELMYLNMRIVYLRTKNSTIWI